MKTIGFHKCMDKVHIRKWGKLKVEAPDAPDYYVGYWWDDVTNTQRWAKPKDDAAHAGDEYYYYLDPAHHDQK